jgi:DNA-binding MarR family transcriptional regulator
VDALRHVRRRLDAPAADGAATSIDTLDGARSVCSAIEQYRRFSLDLAQDLQRAAFRLDRDLKFAAARAGLSAADAALLATLRRAQGIGVCQLAAQASVGRSVMSERVSKLESAGFVERSAPAPGGDRRRVGLHITAAGRKAFGVVARERSAWIEARLARLSPTERQVLEAAVGVLDKLTNDPAMAEA